MRDLPKTIAIISILIYCLAGTAFAQSSAYGNKIYDPGKLKPVDSELKVKVGDPAPDFTLPAVSGQTIMLTSFKNKKNVLLSFVPAAWTPVCSDQWPGYNIAQKLFEKYGTTLLGITVDNIPSLYAWTQEMGDLWFEVLSDFWPHGAVSSRYGVLRSNGTAERALILIDKNGIIQWIHVGDINIRPDLEMIINEIRKLK
ncbi:MAG: peroxiredoxin [Desulfobacteraceae bacterium]|nr:peroxiredoxin [Desulfobacteraceae bacterium]